MKPEGYFLRVIEQTPTEFWINNPTREHAGLAISQGASGCTNNPAYTQKMIDHPVEGAYALKLMDETIRELENEEEVIAEFQRRLVKPICEKFLPVYQHSHGQKGFVSIQGDPLHEEDPDSIIREALENRKLSPNICCKIPTTEAGLCAMEYLISKDIPLNATEIFAIHQAIVMCETYQRASQKYGKAPPLCISHIAGIYDDYLQDVVKKENIEISPDVLWQAGLAVARKLYQLMEERHYPGTFVAGGARGLHHFTEMVGGKVCCTINWEGTADRLLEQDPPVVYRLFNPVPPKVIDELIEKLPDFKRGYLEHGLEIEEFEDFGPVCLFRSSFIKSWTRVSALICEHRKDLKM
ncbi:MAG TPA: transaldolase family protein [Anaerolineales bacterium]|nr:transaldolase family protein [Anaerolineales bacterium]